MKIIILQNAPHVDPGNIIQWGTERGHILKTIRLFDGVCLDDDYDLLLVLGGVPGHCQLWLEKEIGFIRQGIINGKGVLGICLGAQLIVEALNGNLVPHEHSECGWWPVNINSAGKKHPLLSDVKIPEMFFFHRNTVQLPDNMELLASSEGCRNQIFSYGNKVIGIQGHPEVVSENVKYIVDNLSQYADPGDFVNMTPTCHLQSDKFENAGRFLWHVLDNLVEECHLSEVSN